MRLQDLENIDLPENYKSAFGQSVFHNAKAKIDDSIKNHKKMKESRISIRKCLPKHLFQTDPLPVYCFTAMNESVVQSNIRIGYFTVNFTMIFMDCMPPVDLKEIGKGAYGKIFEFINPKNGDVCVAKRQYVPKDSDKPQLQTVKGLMIQHLYLREVIKQFAIYKIADFFDIGPKVVDVGFDIVCYNGSAQFYLQKCQRVVKLDFKQQQTLKECVRIMHSISFVHKDIKHLNLLLSKSKDKLVLCDFGISQSLTQKAGEKTMTSYCGTKGFNSEQMKNIQKQKNKRGYVDLWMNDVQSMNITIQLFDKDSVLQSKDQSQQNRYYQANFNNSFDINRSYKYPETKVSNSQQSTTFGYQEKSPVYELINSIFEFYKQRKDQSSKPKLNDYEWMKFLESIPNDQQKFLGRAFKSQQCVLRNLIYCYGYSSKLLEKVKQIDRDYYILIKKHFKSSYASQHLKHDFHYKFKNMFERMTKIQLELSLQSHKEQDLNNKKLKTVQSYYRELQRSIINQFKLTSSCDSVIIHSLLKKMKQIIKFKQTDQIWNIYVLFAESCIAKECLYQKIKNLNALLTNLKYVIHEMQKQHQQLKIFECLKDLITISSCSISSIEKGVLYLEIVAVQSHMPQTIQILNKCYVLKYAKQIDANKVEELKKQLMPIIQTQFETNGSQQDDLIGTQAKAVFWKQLFNYEKSLFYYNKLNQLLLSTFGLNKQILSTFYSISECSYQLRDENEFMKAFKTIQQILGKLSLNDIQIIGNFYYRIKNFKKAKKYYSRCLSNSQTNIQCFEYYIATCYKGLMQWQKAIIHYENSLIIRDQKGLICEEYLLIQIDVVECKSYLFQQKNAHYFAQKYQQILKTVQKQELGLPINTVNNLQVKIYLRLLVLYQKFGNLDKKKQMKDILIQRGFDFQTDNLDDRSEMYQAFGMIQNAYIYAYASGKRLGCVPNPPQYYKKIVKERIQKLGVVLDGKNKVFREQFKCIRDNKQYSLPVLLCDLKQAIQSNFKLFELMPTLQLFYSKQEMYQGMVCKLNFIFQCLLQKIRGELQKQSNSILEKTE